MTYLFLGQDAVAKDIKLKSIKQEFLSAGYHQFNCDTLYAKELSLPMLQEKMLTLPFKSPKRIIVIKDAAALKDDIGKFIVRYSALPAEYLILILDIDRADPQNGFIKNVLGLCRVYRFKENPKVDTFVLCRYIEAKRSGAALEVLNRLLGDGEKPERILGGLRYSWERQETIAAGKRLRSLLECDIDIKTGRIKPEYALEKLVIGLSAG